MDLKDCINIIKNKEKNMKLISCRDFGDLYLFKMEPLRAGENSNLKDILCGGPNYFGVNKINGEITVFTNLDVFEDWFINKLETSKLINIE